MLLQPISNIAEIFSRRNIRHIVISPGSRSAPLTLAFARHPKIATYIIPDERSAGFIALGISQNLKVPVGIICTSGTAAINLYPAVAEAFFQEIPLMVMTADRPPEWIDQWDGQTVYQENLYGKHVKSNYSIPVDITNSNSEKLAYRQISEGINIAVQKPGGPVHFNFPFREPFYPEKDEKLVYQNELNIITSEEPDYSIQQENLSRLISIWKQSSKKLILCGQHEFSEKLISTLQAFTSKHAVPLVGDILANIHTIEDAIRYADIFLSKNNEEKSSSLCPDLLITFGRSVISKNLKLFLRSAQIKEHWHLQFGESIRDPFESLTKIIRCDPVAFVRAFDEVVPDDNFLSQKQHNFYELWKLEEHKALNLLESFFPRQIFGEWEATHELIGSLPENTLLHLANSMPVRLANLTGLKHYQNVTVFSNRGTSGIDGCTSTAMGFAITSQQPVVLITGDMAFLYDRNAFWHNYPYPMLRIVVLNNHGGGIFRLINGPAEQPELEEFFESRQRLTAEPVAREFGIEYFHAGSREQLELVWKEFFNFDGKPKLLEIETLGSVNQEIFKAYKKETQNL